MSSTQGIKTVLHPVTDLDKAKAVYTALLGTEPQHDAPEAKLAEVTAAGAVVKDAPRDVGGGRLVATVTDPDGNVLGILQDR